MIGNAAQGQRLAVPSDRGAAPGYSRRDLDIRVEIRNARSQLDRIHAVGKVGDFIAGERGEHEHIRAVAACQRICSGSGYEAVVSDAAGQAVIPCAAVQRVVAFLADDRIGAIAAGKPVSARSADDAVVEIEIRRGYVAGRALDSQRPAAPCDHGIGSRFRNHKIAGKTNARRQPDHVNGVFEIRNRIPLEGGKPEHVRAAAAGQAVRAGVSVERIVPCQAGNRVVPIPAGEGFRAFSALDLIVEVEIVPSDAAGNHAGQGHSAAGPYDRGVGLIRYRGGDRYFAEAGADQLDPVMAVPEVRDRIVSRASAEHEQVIPVTACQAVRAREPRQRIVAARSVDRVVAILACQGFTRFGAGDSAAP